METYLPPNRQLSVKTIAMAAKTTAYEDTYGGWLVAQMYLAGSNVATRKSGGKVTASSIDELIFHGFVLAGDEINCYAEIIRLNRTSLTLHVEAWAHRSLEGQKIKVTEGIFTFISVDDNYEPRSIPGR